MIKSILIIWFGGGLGSVLRYLVQLGMSKVLTVVFPTGTFLINVTGCFVIGLLYGLANRYAVLTAEWRLFLITGLCGGYTTFSSFSYESISLLREGNYLYFILYVGLSVVLGLLATLAALNIVK
ncbi:MULTISPECIES: fluoride efflux transporter CrcB [Chitinophagaceae]